VREQDIIEGRKPICKCKGIRKSVFLKHMKAGLRTVKALPKATGIGGRFFDLDKDDKVKEVTL